MKNYTALLLVAILICGVVLADTLSDKGSKIEDIYQFYEDLAYAVDNRNLSDANLGYNSGAAAKIQIGSDTTVVCSGVFNPVTATNTILFDSSSISIPASKMAIFIVGVDADDTFYTKQSPVVSSANKLVTPLFADGIAPLGTIKVVCGSDGVFVPNTTALNAASNTVTFTDLHTLPVSLNIKQR